MAFSRDEIDRAVALVCSNGYCSVRMWNSTCSEQNAETIVSELRERGLSEANYVVHQDARDHAPFYVFWAYSRSSLLAAQLLETLNTRMGRSTDDRVRALAQQGRDAGIILPDADAQ